MLHTLLRERERGFNGSLYAISNGLCFISHSDDFRPCNGAVPYLVYDQWQYISVLSFGTALLHLLVLAVEFSAVQFEQQRLLLQSFVVIFRLLRVFFFVSSLKCGCVEVFLTGPQVINERYTRQEYQIIMMIMIMHGEVTFKITVLG